MPDLDGFTLLSNMRSKTELNDLPVIVLTGADLTAEQHAQLTALGPTNVDQRLAARA